MDNLEVSDKSKSTDSNEEYFIFTHKISGSGSLMKKVNNIFYNFGYGGAASLMRPREWNVYGWWFEDEIIHKSDNFTCKFLSKIEIADAMAEVMALDQRKFTHPYEYKKLIDHIIEWIDSQ